MKQMELDPFMQEFKKYEISENNESSGKRLIYQIPFSKVYCLEEVLQSLEDHFGTRAYIDIEINSLEDAYINIAKEEHRLLQQLEKHGMQRFSQAQKSDRRFSLNKGEDESSNNTQEILDEAADLKRYTECQAHSTFLS